MRSNARFACLGFLLLLFGFAITFDAWGSKPAPIRRLQVEQTSAGAVAHGLFNDATPATGPPQCGQSHCFGGSNNSSGCYPLTRPMTKPMCIYNPTCRYVELQAQQKGGCNCLCTVTAPPSCAGCSVSGYCPGWIPRRSSQEGVHCRELAEFEVCIDNTYCHSGPLCPAYSNLATWEPKIFSDKSRERIHLCVWRGPVGI